MSMNTKLILDIILILAGAFALVGLGGTAVYLSREDRRRDVQITVRQGHGPRQVITLSADSPVVKRLAQVEGIRLSENVADANAPGLNPRKRRIEFTGLVAGAAVGLVAVLPVAGEIALVAISTVSALLLTSLGEVIARLKGRFTAQEWKAGTTRQQAEAILDAALLRDLPSHFGNSDN